MNIISATFFGYTAHYNVVAAFVCDVVSERADGAVDGRRIPSLLEFNPVPLNRVTVQKFLYTNR